MADGKVVISTRLDNTGFEKGIGKVSGSLGGLKSVLGQFTRMIATAFSATAVIRFGVESSKAAMQLTDALTGLQSIVEGQGRSFTKAKTFLDEYVSDGLIPMTNAVTAYKNLAMRGYDDSQIQQTLIALKDASAYGRQASLSMGEAVQSATEGLKNENSILVDNAGVTKNVAKMWEEYAKSIGTTAANLTQQQKIQAEVAGILEESKYQTGDAAKAAGTLSGQLQQLSFNFNNLKIAVGNMINPIVRLFLPTINTAVAALTRFANAAASLVAALTGVSVSVSSGTEGMADGYSSAADSADDLADATTAAGKAAKKSLAGFDELNKLSDPKSSTNANTVSDSTSTQVAVSADLTVTEGEDQISPALQGVVDKIHALFEPLKNIDTGPILQSFSKLGQSLGSVGGVISDSLEWAWFNVLVPFGEWTIESAAPAALGVLSSALDAVSSVLVALAPFGEWLWNDFLSPMASWTGGAIVSILESVSGALTAFSDWAKDNSPIVQGITGTIAAFFAAWQITSVLAFITNAGGVVGVFKKITAAVNAATIAKLKDKATDLALVALYAKDFIVALGKTIAQIAVSTGTWIADTAAKVANTAAQWAQVAATTAWNAVCAVAQTVTMAFGAAVNFLTSPIGLVVLAIGALIAIVVLLVQNWDTVKAAAVSAWEWIVDAWNSVAEWFDENVIQPVTKFFTDMWTGISTFATDAWNAIKEAFAAAGVWFDENVIQPVVSFFTNLWVGLEQGAAAAWQGLKNAFSSATNWFNDKIIKPVASFFTNMWSGLRQGAADAWEGIKKIFSTVANFFGDIFKKAWEGVKNVFSTGGKIFDGIKDGIITVFKTIVNALIKGINTAVAVPFKGLNGILNTIYSIEIAGVKPFEWLTWRAPVPEIPMLAKGAVLPANKPFLAMVGDQHHGTNVEAPLSTIQEAVAAVMDDYSRGNIAGHQATVAVLQELLEAVLGIQIGDDVLAAAVNRYNRKMAVVTGG